MGIYGIRTKTYREMAKRGEVEKSKLKSFRTQIQNLRDLSVKAGWDAGKIDKRLRVINSAQPQERRVILQKWLRDLGGQT